MIERVLIAYKCIQQNRKGLFALKGFKTIIRGLKLKCMYIK